MTISLATKSNVCRADISISLFDESINRPSSAERLEKNERHVHEFEVIFQLTLGFYLNWLNSLLDVAVPIVCALKKIKNDSVCRYRITNVSYRWWLKDHQCKLGFVTNQSQQVLNLFDHWFEIDHNSREFLLCLNRSINIVHRTFSFDFAYQSLLRIFYSSNRFECVHFFLIEYSKTIQRHELLIDTCSSVKYVPTWSPLKIRLATNPSFNTTGDRNTTWFLNIEIGPTLPLTKHNNFDWRTNDELVLPNEALIQVTAIVLNRH